jgi:ribose-phosphate pyrophosphokinase
MNVVGTQKSQIIARRIAGILDVDLDPTKFFKFPDGELYVQTGPMDDETVIVGSLIDSDAFVQLLLLIDACEKSQITLILPYMGYARQDKRFKEGEPISARAIAQSLGFGIDRIITAHVHEPGVLGHFGVPASNVSLIPEIHQYIASIHYDNPLILAPDEGAEGFAAAIARQGAWEYDYLVKTRLNGEHVRVEPKKLHAQSRTVVIIDDIISTGGTLASAATMLQKQGAIAVHTVCVHGIFTRGAHALLKNSGIEDLLQEFYRSRNQLFLFLCSLCHI